MNRQRALDILGIDDSDEDRVKKAYRTMALRYHPDKNQDKDANEKFQEIHEAYTYLNGSTDPTDYKSLLQSFLRTFLGDGNNDVLHEWIRRITSICEEKAVELLQNIDKHILKSIYELISKNIEILHLSSSFIEKMGEVIKTKFENDERIILHPFLEDLENIYKLKVDEDVYLVPLWHHHLVYDATNGKEIYVDCYPLLPDNICIDEYNNIHIEIFRELNYIWSQDELIVNWGSNAVSIKREELRMIEKQIIPCIGKGISLPTNSYEICDKSNVYIHLTISM